MTYNNDVGRLKQADFRKARKINNVRKETDSEAPLNGCHFVFSVEADESSLSKYTTDQNLQRCITAVLL